MLENELEKWIIAELRISDKRPPELAQIIGVTEFSIRSAIWMLIDRGEVKLTVDRKLAATVE